jgi:two-component system NtrC family sensor kinase
MAGHFFKLAAFYLIYRAILVTGIREPFELIFRERVQAERRLEETVAALTVSNEELDQTNRYLKDAQARILQQEKMASIGQLAAGVAHEINNPMGFIISNLGTLRKYSEKRSRYLTLLSDTVRDLAADDGPRGRDSLERIEESRVALKIDCITADIGSLIKESLDGADRVRRIVQDLKSFSRVDEAEEKPADINACLDSTLNIVWNELKYKAEVRKEYGVLPQTVCNARLLNQVFMNLLINAAEAIESCGEITIATRSDGKFIEAAISDTGCGMSADTINRIFEPFYTTKDIGKGTGLGLSIAYDIIKKHGGEITVESEPGRGSRFTVRLPIRSEADAPHVARMHGEREADESLQEN